MYNLELEDGGSDGDDRLWVEQTTRVVTHNCLPKDLGNLIDCVEASGLTAPVMRAARERNTIDRARPAAPRHDQPEGAD